MLKKVLLLSISLGTISNSISMDSIMDRYGNIDPSTAGSVAVGTLVGFTTGFGSRLLTKNPVYNIGIGLGIGIGTGIATYFGIKLFDKNKTIGDTKQTDEEIKGSSDSKNIFNEKSNKSNNIFNSDNDFREDDSKNIFDKKPDDASNSGNDSFNDESQEQKNIEEESRKAEEEKARLAEQRRAQELENQRIAEEQRIAQELENQENTLNKINEEVILIVDEMHRREALIQTAKDEMIRISEKIAGAIDQAQNSLQESLQVFDSFFTGKFGDNPSEELICRVCDSQDANTFAAKHTENFINSMNEIIQNLDDLWSIYDKERKPIIDGLVAELDKLDNPLKENDSLFNEIEGATKATLEETVYLIDRTIARSIQYFNNNFDECINNFNNYKQFYLNYYYKNENQEA